jgi:hypothetical protein
MMSPAQDTATFLAASAVTGPLGGSVDWSVYVGREPLEPASVVTVYDTGGGANVLVDLRKPTVQVRVRSDHYLDGWVKSDEAYKELVTPASPATIDGVTFQWVATSEIYYIGRDDADRCLFTCNYQLLRDGA